MLTPEKRFRLRELLTDQATMDLGDQELADFADCDVADAREYRMEFCWLMQWAFEQIQLSGAALKIWGTSLKSTSRARSSRVLKELKTD